MVNAFSDVALKATLFLQPAGLRDNICLVSWKMLAYCGRYYWLGGGFFLLGLSLSGEMDESDSGSTRLQVQDGSENDTFAHTVNEKDVRDVNCSAGGMER